MPKKRKKRRRRGAFSRLLRPLSLLLAAAAIVAALTMFFKVESIQVAGASRYQADEIIAASGVEPGDNLVLLDRYRVSQRGWWLLSAGGKLLEAVDAAGAAEYPRIAGIQAENPAVSAALVLPEDSPITAQRLQELLDTLAAHEALPLVDSINCASPRELVLHYDGRFQVEMFYDADFDFKITYLLSAVDQLEPNQKGILRMTMSDDYEVRFIPSAE